MIIINWMKVIHGKADFSRNKRQREKVQEESTLCLFRRCRERPFVRFSPAFSQAPCVPAPTPSRPVEALTFLVWLQTCPGLCDLSVPFDSRLWKPIPDCKYPTWSSDFSSEAVFSLTQWGLSLLFSLHLIYTCTIALSTSYLELIICILCGLLHCILLDSRDHWYGLNVCVPSKVIRWSPHPQRDGIWSWGLWEVIRFGWIHEGGAPWSDWSSHKRERDESSPPPLMKIHWESGCRLGSSHPEPHLPAPRSWISQLPEQ